MTPIQQAIETFLGSRKRLMIAREQTRHAAKILASEVCKDARRMPPCELEDDFRFICGNYLVTVRAVDNGIDQSISPENHIQVEELPFDQGASFKLRVIK